MPKKLENNNEEKKLPETTKKEAKNTAKRSSTSKASSKNKKNSTKEKSSRNNQTSKVSATSKFKENKSNKTTKTKKNTNSKTTVPTPKRITKLAESYELPVSYNQTVIKVLFQTPKKLFVYWEISEHDRLKFMEDNGENFFENSSPFLIVKNKTKNYSFEVAINDYANSWYFNIPDSDCDYEVELIRKTYWTNNWVSITSSNHVEVPNNHILFEQNRMEVFYKNVKNNTVTNKSVVNLQLISHLGNIYPATQVFYSKFYDKEDLYGELSNPSS